LYKLIELFYVYVFKLPTLAIFLFQELMFNINIQKGWNKMKIAKKINVVIVEEDALTRMVTKYMCQGFANLSVCAEYDNAEDALAYIVKNKVDMVLLDMYLPKMNGIEISNILKRINPALKIIMVVHDVTENGVLGSIFAKADAFIMLNDLNIEHFQHIIKVVFDDGYWFDFKLLHRIFGSLNAFPKPDYCYLCKVLTPIEINLIRRILQGFSIDEAALALNLGMMELSEYVNSIFQKLSRTNIAEKVLRSVKYDMV